MSASERAIEGEPDPDLAEPGSGIGHARDSATEPPRPAPRDPPGAYGELLARGMTALDAELLKGAVRGPADGEEAALSLLLRAYALRADDPELLHAMGVGYGARALQLLQRSRNEVGLVNGHDTMAEDALQRAIFALSRAAEIDPRATASLNELAALFALRGDRDSAIDALKRSLQAAPDQPDARDLLEELGAF